MTASRTPLVLLAALALGVSGCGRGGDGRPDVVLVVADALRADRLASYGSTRGLTPFLDTLAARGVVFRRAYAASSASGPSVASLFTSRLPYDHGVVGDESWLPDEETTLAERLAPGGSGRIGQLLRRDYLAAGFSANRRLRQRRGYGQGFDSWHAYNTIRKPRADWLGRRVLAWLDGWRWRAVRTIVRRPLFLYLHFMEPHAPYDPPAAYRPRPDAGVDPASAGRKLLERRWSELDAAEIAALQARYEGEVASLDARLRALFAQLDARGVLERAVLVVTADHGEEFAEHGALLHGETLYDPAVRVPLIIVGAGVPAGRVVDETVSLLDVAPTLLELTGLPPEPRFEGRSLVPLIAGEGGMRDAVAELWSSGGRPRRHALALVRTTTKFLVGGDGESTETYDIRRDPEEAHPFYGGHLADALVSRTRERKAAVERRVNESRRAGSPPR